MKPTKYNIGDKVWTLRLNKAKRFKIAYIDQVHIIKQYTSKDPIETEVHKYYLQGVDQNVRWYEEGELFDSKQDLINSL